MNYSKKIWILTKMIFNIVSSITRDKPKILENIKLALSTQITHK